MIFHICPPESKFIPSLIERFEKVKPGLNKCFIIVSPYHKNPAINLEKNLIEYFGPLNESVIKRFNNSCCKGIVVHTLNDDILQLSLNLADHFPVIWRSWGPDLHDIIYPENDLLLPHTKQLVYGDNMIYRSSLNLLRSLSNQITGIKKEGKERINKKIEFIKKLNSIATVTATEYKMLKNLIPKMNAKHLILNYRSLDFNKLPGISTGTRLDNIIVGHSGYSYHNHADIYFKLKNDSYEGSIMSPLNYGNSQYRRRVIVLGKKLFNGHINFLTDFLNFDEYIKFIGNYSAFIQNSKAQSGGGNTIYFLFRGSKVYLREENPIYIDFKEYGIKLFSVQKDLSSRHLLNEDISYEDKLNNRKIIETLFCTEREKENITNIYRTFSIKV